MAYPDDALVEAAICEVAQAVDVVENNWLKFITPLVAVEQSGTPLPLIVIEAPVQKTSDSGIVPLS
jgi:hypothetical protein